MAAITAEIKHGTSTGYTYHRCRCDDCRHWMREYQRTRRGSVIPDEPRDNALCDLLHELCPFGLTDDAPIRRAMRATEANRPGAAVNSPGHDTRS